MTQADRQREGSVSIISRAWLYWILPIVSPLEAVVPVLIVAALKTHLCEQQVEAWILSQRIEGGIGREPVHESLGSEHLLENLEGSVEIPQEAFVAVLASDSGNPRACPKT